MEIPWPQVDSASALIFAVLGLAVAWLSYRAGVRSHHGQLRVETMSLVDTTRSIVEKADAERPSLFKWFQQLYAAQGKFNSGAMEVKQREFDDFATGIEALRGELAIASAGIDRLSGRKLELRLVEVRAIHGRATGIKDKFAQYQRELREDAAEHRAHTLAANRAKEGIKGKGA